MPNSVSTLGTLHDIFLSNPKYGLKEFISALHQFKPDVILSEIRIEYPTSEDAAIDGGIEQSIVFAYAKENSIPVLATDWFDDELIKEMEEEGTKITPELEKSLQVMSKYHESFNSASLIELSSKPIQNHVREIYHFLEKHGFLCSRKRNDRILANIIKELNNLENKRVLIVYGMDHKFFIDDHLSNLTNTTLLDISSWFLPSKSESFEIPNSLKAESINNLKKSSALLQERLKSHYYSQELELKLRNKQDRFEKWITSITLL